MKRLLLGTLLFVCTIALAVGLFLRFVLGYPDGKEVAATPEPTPEPTVEPTPTPEPTIDPAVFTDINSLLVVANKAHKLPEGYEPSDLVDANAYGGRGTIAPYMRQEAAEALGQMTSAAQEDGVYLMFSSAYRSESYQSQLYYGYVNSYGVERADRISARPGYSDHQTGLALDFIENGPADLRTEFEDTASGKWLKDHAHEYGFIMRYPKDKETITGYNYEPWHFRYIGVDYATAIYNVDPFYSFEEYFDVEGGQEYKE